MATFLPPKPKYSKQPSFSCHSGYFQGMNDLLAVIMTVIDEEEDAFWCFAGLLDRLVSKFPFLYFYLTDMLFNLPLVPFFIVYNV